MENREIASPDGTDGRGPFSGITRAEAAVCAVCCAALAVFTRAFWPTREIPAHVHTAVFGVAALLSLLKALFPASDFRAVVERILESILRKLAVPLSPVSWSAAGRALSALVMAFTVFTPVHVLTWLYATRLSYVHAAIGVGAAILTLGMFRKRNVSAVPFAVRGFFLLASAHSIMLMHGVTVPAPHAIADVVFALALVAARIIGGLRSGRRMRIGGFLKTFPALTLLLFIPAHLFVWVHLTNAVTAQLVLFAVFVALVFSRRLSVMRENLPRVLFGARRDFWSWAALVAAAHFVLWLREITLPPAHFALLPAAALILSPPRFIRAIVPPWAISFIKTVLGVCTGAALIHAALSAHGVESPYVNAAALAAVVLYAGYIARAHGAGWDDSGRLRKLISDSIVIFAFAHPLLWLHAGLGRTAHIAAAAAIPAVVAFFHALDASPNRARTIAKAMVGPPIWMFLLLTANSVFWMLYMSMGALVVRSFHTFSALGLVCFMAGVPSLYAILARTCAKWPRRTLFTALFAAGFAIVPMSLMMWKPPSPSECAAFVEQGIIEKIEMPAAYREKLSYPYEVIFIPEKPAVATSFKMAGNNMIFFWDDPAANMLMVSDTGGTGPPRTAVLPMRGAQLPQHLAWDPGRESLFVTRTGAGKHFIQEIDLKDFEAPAAKNIVQIDFEPNGIILNSDGKSLTVVGIDGRFARYRTGNLKPLEPSRPLPFGKMATMFRVVRHPRKDVFYLSMLGQFVAEFDPASWKARKAKTPLGAGSIDIDPATGLLYEPNPLFDVLTVVDTRVMKLVKNVKLGFKPRPVVADNSRDLLIVGGWFNGRVYFHKLSTLAPLKSIPAGRYIRDFAYDEERGILYYACNCGVYSVDVEAAAAGEKSSGD